uniref:Alkylcitrate dehydratase phiI n=1 Tax=Fungal sp. (strain ATCC 74256) TaxID=1729595 RepID=PHII_FUNX7|nr:RecName: Full=Alkylcitrate dehydratase phiI; Short=ACDH; AltName: Full=Phomoidride biosynthesis cluster protein I [fungal sp. ATCC 74256]BBG28506.1 putative 2-methylcitrate dehydratase [fungal sp. ATCC 74256]
MQEAQVDVKVQSTKTLVMSSQYDKEIAAVAHYMHNYHINDRTTYQKARISLLDSLGCAIETVSKSAEVRSLLGPAVPGSKIPNGFRLPGTSYVLSPVEGAFDMGILIRYLDHNDALGGAEWGHPSDNLGAILSVMDWISRSSAAGIFTHNGPPMTMHTLLTATIKAYEIQGCYQLLNAFNIYGIDHVVLVKLASTAAVSWLLGLTEEQTMAAISHVWMDGQPTRVYRSGEDTIPRKGWAAGDACMRAVHIAFLVKHGQPGSPGALTNPRSGFYVKTFGDKGFQFARPFGEWAIRNVYLKTMPVEGHGISSVEAALIQRERLQERGLGLKDISGIDIRTTAAANLIINKTGRLHNAADRDHCIQYVIALAFIKGSPPEPEDYADDSPFATSQEIDALRDKTIIRPDEQLTRDYLDIEKKSAGAGMTIYLEDGTTMEEVLIEYPSGHMSNPKTKKLVEGKFERNMRLKFDDGEIMRIKDALNEDSMRVHEFLDLFVRKGQPGSPRL